MTAINNLPDLCEFNVQLLRDVETDGDILFVVDLRIHSGEIALGDEECEVCFTKLTISIDLEGLDTPRKRYGEPKKQNAVKLTKSSKQTNKRRKSGSLGFAANLKKGANFKGGVKASTSTEQEYKLENKEESEHLRVQARPNLRWEITEPDAETLDSTYLEEDILFQTKKYWQQTGKRF